MYAIRLADASVGAGQSAAAATLTWSIDASSKLTQSGGLRIAAIGAFANGGDAVRGTNPAEGNLASDAGNGLATADANVGLIEASGQVAYALGGDPALGSYAEAIAGGPARWIGYLSTIGVYGDQCGAWIDEATLPAPTHQRTRDRVAAEESWLALGARTGKAVQVFRLSGIYGPGRNAFEKLRQGKAQRIVKAGQVFNRIHVDDIATTLAASLARPRPGARRPTCRPGSTRCSRPTAIPRAGTRRRAARTRSRVGSARPAAARTQAWASFRISISPYRAACLCA